MDGYQVDADAAVQLLLEELAKARGTMMTLKSHLERGAFQAALNLVDATLAEMRPVHLPARGDHDRPG